MSSRAGSKLPGHASYTPDRRRYLSASRGRGDVVCCPIVAPGLEWGEPLSLPGPFTQGYALIVALIGELDVVSTGSSW